MKSRGLGVYKEAHAQELDQARLILMMYSGAVRFLDKAIEAGDNDAAVMNDQVSRAKRVILELMASIDIEHGGEMSVTLLTMYRRLFAKLNEAHIRDDLVRIGEVRDSMIELESAWREVFKSPEYHEFKQDPAVYRIIHGISAR